MVPRARAHAPLALWSMYSMSSKLDVGSKRLGTAVATLNPNHLHGKMKVRLAHTLQVASLLYWGINRNVLVRFSPFSPMRRGCRSWGLAKPTEQASHSQEKASG